MYEATETDTCSQLVRIPTATSRVNPFPEQADPSRQIYRCSR